MPQPDPTLINDERLLAEAIAAAARLHDKPRRWMARYGGYVTLGRGCVTGAGEYRKIVKEMSEKVKAKAVKAESAKW
jgi:hypothetical protein